MFEDVDCLLLLQSSSLPNVLFEGAVAAELCDGDFGLIVLEGFVDFEDVYASALFGILFLQCQLFSDFFFGVLTLELLFEFFEVDDFEGDCLIVLDVDCLEDAGGLFFSKVFENAVLGKLDLVVGVVGVFQEVADDGSVVPEGGVKLESGHRVCFCVFNL